MSLRPIDLKGLYLEKSFKFLGSNNNEIHERDLHVNQQDDVKSYWRDRVNQRIDNLTIFGCTLSKRAREEAPLC